MTPIQFRLRTACAADFPTLWEIDQLCFSDEIAYSQAELSWAMSEPEAITLVAELPQGKIAGFLVACRDRPRTGHIITIDVRPGFRGHGIGNALMQEVEQKFAMTGASRIRLEAAVDNLPALQFYKGRGYRVVKVLPEYYPGPLDGLLLEKDNLGDAVATSPEMLSSR